MRFFGNASGFSKVAFVLLFCAIGIFCAGLGTASWMQYRSMTQSTDLSVGLWKMVNCSSAYQDTCIGEKLSDNYNTKLLTVTQGLECLALVILVLTTIVQVFYATSPTVRTRKVAFTVIVFAFLFTALCVGGMIAWIVNIPDNHYMSWSLGLCLIAASMAVLAAILMVPDIRKYRRKKSDEEREIKREKRLRQKELRREKSGAFVEKGI